MQEEESEQILSNRGRKSGRRSRRRSRRSSHQTSQRTYQSTSLPSHPTSTTPVHLSEINGFIHLRSTFEECSQQPLLDWLEVEDVFPNSGKQGVVGILKTENDERYIFKLSQYLNYLPFHEYTVMEGLNELRDYCPHFCKSMGIVNAKVDANYSRVDNPFAVECKYPIEKEVLLLELIQDSCKLYNYIRSDKISDDVIFSSIKQTLLAVSMAQRHKRFSHYDLHSYNVMMKKCNPNLVFLYVLDERTQFVIPTYGHYPVIIDFGFSYIEDMNGGFLWPSLAHTDVGFMSDRFDWVSDPKLFLVSVAYELRMLRKNRSTRIFKNIVKNIFSCLNIDWGSGWDQTEEQGASDYVLESLEEVEHTSELFREYEHYCIDIIQSLIILPLEPYDYKDLSLSYSTFLQEFVKIENEIGSHFYNLYILKGVVDAARMVQREYLSPKQRDSALLYFQRSVYQRVDEVAKFCSLSTIHFEKMLCGLLKFARCVEGLLYDVMRDVMKRKKKEYRKLRVRSVDEILGILETNLPSEYTFNENSRVVVLDGVKKSAYNLFLTGSEIREVNEYHTLARGSYLYNLTKDKLEEI